MRLIRGVPIDWRNPLQLRIVAAALCQDFRRELARFDAGALTGVDLSEVYESVYQDRTVSLLDALMHYAPADWGLTVGYAARGQRMSRCPEYDAATGRLHPTFAAVELTAIMQALETLARQVPQK